MQTYTCKCGNMICYSSMGYAPCERCSKCGTSYRGIDPIPHVFQGVSCGHEGHPQVLTCQYCWQTPEQIAKKEVYEPTHLDDK